MSRKLRIVVADDEPDMQEYFRETLSQLGHEVIAVARDGDELVERCRDSQPDLVISDIRMPGRSGLEAARAIYDERPVPIVIVSAFSDAELIARAEESHVLAYLVKPIREQSLGPAIAIALRQFDQFKALRSEAVTLKQALEDRKIIEKAKGILMKQTKLDEESAFRRLQKLASKNNRKLVDIARALVEASEAFEPAED
jgi:response regulator NasT